MSKKHKNRRKIEKKRKSQQKEKEPLGNEIEGERNYGKLIQHAFERKLRKDQRKGTGVLFFSVFLVSLYIKNSREKKKIPQQDKLQHKVEK